MMTLTQLLAGVTLLLGLSVPSLVDDNAPDSSTPLPVARIRFEQNATDRDAEIVFEIKAGTGGLAKLVVISPDGRTVIDYTAPDSSTLGMRQFTFESPETGNVKSLKSAYPEGVYSFTASTTSGTRLHGKSTLKHTLPPTVNFLYPKAEGQGVETNNLKITWTAVKNPAAYIVYIEQDQLDVSITARLPGTVASFDVPDGFLLAGKEYVLGIGTVAGDGNVSFVETTFTTARNNTPAHGGSAR